MEDQEVIKEFLIESSENLSRLDQELVELERNPCEPELLAGVFRTFHTIKGTCGFLGFGRLERVAHQAESILCRLRAFELELTPELISLILRAVDAMRVHLAAIEATAKEAETSDDELCGALRAATEAGKPAAARPIADLETAPPRGQNGVADSAIRVDVHLLDKLMNLVGELVLTRNQILQFTSSQEGAALISSSQRLNLITSELQESVMKTRMQPIGVVWNKMPRLVRDVAMACGKRIALDMDGAGTELDKTIIEAIKDPITHIVRNCCDHGIEKPQLRKTRGKPIEGRLSLRAFHEGGQVIIEIADDGGGVDIAAVKAKAIAAGLLRAAQAESLSERDALNLLFEPGLSTARMVTSVSGRGVGMDVVRTNIERIGGAVEVASQSGTGTTIRLKIPLTLAIIPGLVVALGERRSAPRPTRAGRESGTMHFIIPQVNLIELVRLEGDTARHSIERIRDTAVYRLRGNLLPIVYLHAVLGSEGQREDSEVVNIAVLQAGDRQFGLVVDGIRDTQEIVVKPLGKHLKGLTCYAGATIMGDGRVALILDVLGIAQRCGEVVNGSRDREQSGQAEQSDQAIPGKQAFLLFRSGRFERLAVPLSTVSRLEEFPQTQLERAGGRLAVQYRGRILPLIPLAQILDPGSADTASQKDPVQAVVFQSGERTLGLVIDGLADIVDDTASMTQASGRRGLLGSAVIDQRFTDLLDLETVLKVGWDDWINGTPVSSNAGLGSLVAAIDPATRINELAKENA
ncbi:chemotaxis protein CheA [Paludibaculum fermentans]|uniref:chemotaxis protein CheA n=1 Tax=Paludibaculum fermentans TaxID=1473598 RepID=UPI003EC00DA3